MKYDRPVWQIMHACADAMPAVFRYGDVRDWFDGHFPDVTESTVRAHLIGLTEGGRAKHPQFAQRSPVFRRVARGEYSAIPFAERGEQPDVAAPAESADEPEPVEGVVDLATPATGHRVPKLRDATTAPAPDIILLGSLGERVNVPAPAKEVFREVAFQLGRLDAEISGSQWFVLSAEHGLVAPNEWMSPDLRTLDDMDVDYRAAWASWVVTRLQSLVGPVDGLSVRVDAPDLIVGPLFADLQAAGAVISSGGVVVDPPAAAAPRAVWAPGRDTDVSAAVVPAVVRRSAAGRHLADPVNAVRASGVAMLPQSPGLYGWVIDRAGARMLNRCLQLPVRPGLVFVGQVGGSSWHSLVDPVLNLRDHIDRVQLNGRTRASTFRMTLATVLREHLGMTSIEDRLLTDWMLEHLSVAVWTTDDIDSLHKVLQLVVGELDPPLNVDHLPATEYRARLQQMRAAPA